MCVGINRLVAVMIKFQTLMSAIALLWTCGHSEFLSLPLLHMLLSLPTFIIYLFHSSFTLNKKKEKGWIDFGFNEGIHHLLAFPLFLLPSIFVLGIHILISPFLFR